MPIGVPIIRTNDFNLTRSELIELAYKQIGVLEDGNALRASLLTDGVKWLNLIIRQLADEELYLHGQVTSTLTLVAEQWAYTEDDDLAVDMGRLVACAYRDPTGSDHPVQIINRIGYEAIPNKLQTGDPEKVFLTDETDFSIRTLYLWPARNTVNTQSVVTGTDAIIYKCIRSHTAASDNHPITGPNYKLYWEAGGSSPSAWASGTSYMAPQLLRLTYERLLYDFDVATHNPDIPSSQTRFLLYRLSADLGSRFGLPIDRVSEFRQEAERSREKTFARAQRKVTTDYHNKACLF